MKTEAKVEETIKETRKQLFWRLYSLPILLTLCIGFFGYWVMSSQNSFMRQMMSQNVTGTNAPATSVTIITEMPTSLVLKVEGSFPEIPEKIEFILPETEPMEPDTRLHEETLELLEDQIEKIFYLEYAVQEISLLLADVLERSETRGSETRGSETGSVDRVFTMDDYKWAEDLGINLEEHILGAVMIVVGNVCENLEIPESDEQILRDELDKGIRKSFDGFETYKKVNQKVK
jgi:hypothetical protein